MRRWHMPIERFATPAQMGMTDYFLSNCDTSRTAPRAADVVMAA